MKTRGRWKTSWILLAALAATVGCQTTTPNGKNDDPLLGGASGLASQLSYPGRPAPPAPTATGSGQVPAIPSAATPTSTAALAVGPAASDPAKPATPNPV